MIAVGIAADRQDIGTLHFRGGEVVDATGAATLPAAMRSRVADALLSWLQHPVARRFQQTRFEIHRPMPFEISTADFFRAYALELTGSPMRGEIRFTGHRYLQGREVVEFKTTGSVDRMTVRTSEAGGWRETVVENAAIEVTEYYLRDVGLLLEAYETATLPAILSNGQRIVSRTMKRTSLDLAASHGAVSLSPTIPR